MPSYILTDVAADLWVDSFSLTAADLGVAAEVPWSVTKRTLKGGRRDGVDLIRLDNGAFSLDIVPTRGMSFRQGSYKGDRIGWTSAVTDGPVNPKFVNLMNWGGLGWLEGYDEMLVRCGLENIGSPYQETVESPDGTRRDVLYGLHGKIGNIPAHKVAVHYTPETQEISIEGQVDESKPFAPQIRLATRITTKPGSNKVIVRDEYVNLRESPSEMQVLYHWNFGAPILEEGARVVAPIKTVLPRDKRAQEGLGHYDVYNAPEPGYAEQVYFFELHGEGKDGRTIAMLRNREGTKAVALRFSLSQLPAFTVWKNTAGLKEGYVTGLEPSTSYPNARPFEKARKRVLTLPPGGSHVVETTLEVLDSAKAVAAVEAEIKSLQAKGAPTVHPRPVEPFAPEG
jgi:hypothetical protein